MREQLELLEKTMPIRDRYSASRWPLSERRAHPEILKEAGATYVPDNVKF
jgi:hypothetical protein